MSTLLNFILAAVIVLCVVFILRSMRGNNNKSNDHTYSPLNTSTQDQHEDYFGFLMSQITPIFYWRVHNEYIDFIQATIKRMDVNDIVSQPDLFNAQRRCSDLNSAVHRYYENIKKRCADGEKVPVSDIEVINLRQCFNELSGKAYPELVALIWPQYQCPVMTRKNIIATQSVAQGEALAD